MADSIPHVVTVRGASADAPDGSVPIGLYGAGAAVTQAAGQANLAGGADLPTTVAAHNALLAKLRSAGVIAATPV